MNRSRTATPILITVLVLALAAAAAVAFAADQHESPATDAGTSPAGASSDESRQARPVDPGKADSPLVERAIAVLSPTEGHEVHGVVRFLADDTGEGLVVHSEVQGLPGPAHAYHVHLLGDCSADDGTSAGTHFNFQGSATDPPEDIERITGNLGNLEVDGSGQSEHRARLENATLSGPYSLIGRSVVVHADANDPGKPPIGGAGSRLACGVIGIDRA